MCGRLNMTDSPLVLELFEKLGILWEQPLQARYNIAPTEQVLVIRDTGEQYIAEEMRWWLVPSWSDGPSSKFAMFNARIETVASSRAYKGPFKHQRCVVVASSFVEWQRQGSRKQPYEIAPAEGPLLLAGIWDEWRKEIKSCSIITQEARDSFGWLHHRMPLALDAEQAALWMASNDKPEALLDHLQGECVALQAVAIEDAFNNARNKAAPVAISEAKPV